MGKDEIKTSIQKNGDNVKKLGVKRLGLFGSFARNEQTFNSDVDFLVEFYPGKKTFDNFMNLSFLLESLIDKEIELVTLESLSPFIGPHILKEVEYVPLDK